MYFNGRGFAEQSRFIFAQAGVEYNDVRFDGKDWQAIKPTLTLPFGVLPVLEVDGKPIGGSVVIARYLGEQFGLAGKDEFENAQIANVVDAIQDLNMEVIRYRFEKDDARKAEMKKKLINDTLPAKLQYFEKRASTNENGWMYNGRLTWADFSVYIGLDRVRMVISEDALKDFPGLKNLCASVEALPNIAKWIKERPVTDF